jgi:hypothetical protein
VSSVAPALRFAANDHLLSLAAGLLQSVAFKAPGALMWHGAWNLIMHLLQLKDSVGWCRCSRLCCLLVVAHRDSAIVQLSVLLCLIPLTLENAMMQAHATQVRLVGCYLRLWGSISNTETRCDRGLHSQGLHAAI